MATTKVAGVEQYQLVRRPTLGGSASLGKVSIMKGVSGLFRPGSPFALPVEELKSPVRPMGFEPPQRTWREVAPGHLVMV